MPTVKILKHFEQLVDCDIFGAHGSSFMMNHYEIVKEGTKTSQGIAKFLHKSCIGNILHYDMVALHPEDQVIVTKEQGKTCHMGILTKEANSKMVEYYLI